MRKCESCGYKDKWTDKNSLKRCIRCGSSFTLANTANKLLGVLAEQRADTPRASHESPYVRMMEARGWTCHRPWPEHVQGTLI